jgi:hypothetical protein
MADPDNFRSADLSAGHRRRGRLVLLLEASRRALGPALTIVAAPFLAYSYFGTGWLIPELIEHPGRSFTAHGQHPVADDRRRLRHPLGVSTAFVFLFVLFGALLDKAGAGNYFIKMAFAGLGPPARRAGQGGGRRLGRDRADLGLVDRQCGDHRHLHHPADEARGLHQRKGRRGRGGESSVNGQIMPPVMGAAAFLMVEFVGISYLEVIKHAFIPAVISYIALVYIVHLEALKKDMPALGEAPSLLRCSSRSRSASSSPGRSSTARSGAWRCCATPRRGADPVLLVACWRLYLGALWVAAGARPGNGRSQRQRRSGCR